MKRKYDVNMNKELLSQDELMEWSRAKTRPALERWLNSNRIAFTLDAKNKIVTTLSAINAGILGVIHVRELDHV